MHAWSKPSRGDAEESAANYGTYPQQGADGVSPNLLAKKLEQLKADAEDRASWQLSGFSLAFRLALSWGTFTIVCLLFALYLRHLAVLAWFVSVLCIMLSMYWMSFWMQNKEKRPKYWFHIGVLMFAAVGSGIFIGRMVYYYSTVDYYVHEELRFYGNVAAGENPNSMPDVGMMSFSADSAIDFTKGVSTTTFGRVFCAAPILDTSATSTDAATSVGFWAVGFDCCPGGEFKCVDSNLAGARGGYAMYDLNIFTQGYVPAFQKVVEKGARIYEYTLPSRVQFVTWVQDVYEFNDEKWVASVEYTIVASCSYLLATIFLSTHVMMSSKGQWGQDV